MFELTWHSLIGGDFNPIGQSEGDTWFLHDADCLCCPLSFRNLGD